MKLICVFPKCDFGNFNNFNCYASALCDCVINSCRLYATIVPIVAGTLTPLEL